MHLTRHTPHRARPLLALDPENTHTKPQHSQPISLPSLTTTHGIVKVGVVIVLNAAPGLGVRGLVPNHKRVTGRVVDEIGHASDNRPQHRK
jgi:hypothetical protein